MSAGREEAESLKLAIADWTATTTFAGHDLAWRLGENARRKGHAYFWVGDCRNCGGNMIIGTSWTSCRSVVDVRHTPCSGPGTYVLTDIEQARFAELLAGAVAEFGVAVRQAGALLN